MPPAAKGVALVTGASRGVGRACALALAQRGYDVGIGYAVSAEAAAEVASAVGELGRGAVTVAGDIRTEAGCLDVVERTAAALGTISVVVSNATGYPAGTTRGELAQGFDPSLGPTLGTPNERYAETFDARALALLTLARATVPAMPRGGSLIALTSTGTRGYFPGYGPTAVGMAAVECLVRYLAIELGPRGIRVNVVSGGPVRTDALSLMARDASALADSLAAQTPLGRIGEPADLAQVVAFLASEESGWITGQTLVADGGHILA